MHARIQHDQERDGYGATRRQVDDVVDYDAEYLVAQVHLQLIAELELGGVDEALEEDVLAGVLDG